jgi:hypothetical protein
MPLVEAAGSHYSLERTGLSPLQFIGRLIGDGTTQHAGDPERWTEVRIYRTKGGRRYIAQLNRMTRHSGEKVDLSVQLFDKPLSVIEWLGSPDAGVSPASQTAMEKAAKNDPAFREAWWCERIEL